MSFIITLLLTNVLLSLSMEKLSLNLKPSEVFSKIKDPIKVHIDYV